MERNGYKVKRVMNITDVGHLTGDTDEGEDKIEKEARLEKKSVTQLARFYEKAFLNDLKKLNIKIPKALPRAADYVPEQIKIIQAIFKNGFAYETSRAVYFDVSKFENYGKFSRQSLKEKMTASRKEVVTDPEKRNPADFALWFKLTGKFKHHILHWSSPWEEGFPGWHIECSAISRKFLGQPFDIHTGGVDLIGTHHENEIAQSEGAYRKPLANYWLHGEFLLIDKAKMAKSEGNFFTFKDIEERGVHPLAFRYLVLTSHYRSKLNFTWRSVAAAENALYGLYQFVRDAEAAHRKIKDGEKARICEEKFIAAINNDLDTPKAISLVWKLIKNTDLRAGTKKQLLLKFDKVLGFGLNQVKPLKIPREIKQLATKREQFRKNKQFMQADRLREKINLLGYIIEDTPKGPVVLPKNPKR